MIEFGEYSRKTFDVKAVQVTTENVEELANLSGGKIGEDKQGKYLQLGVSSKEWQGRARIGGWLVKLQNSYKAYSDDAFHRTFMPNQKKTPELGKVLDLVPSEILQDGKAVQEEGKDPVALDPKYTKLLPVLDALVKLVS